MTESIQYIEEFYNEQEKSIIICDISLLPETSKSIVRLLDVSQVKKLGFQWVNFEPKSIRPLYSCQWDSLQKLILFHYDRKLELNEFQELTLLPFSKLKELQISKDKISANESALLAKVDWPIQVLKLDIQHMSGLSIKQISLGKWNLQSLRITVPFLDAQMLKDLSFSSWENLNQLALYNNKITDAGCKYIARGPWSNLKFLNLQNNSISSIGIKWFAKANWQRLQYLNLGSNAIDCQAMKNISLSLYPCLKTIYMEVSTIDCYESTKIFLNWQYPRLNLILSGNLTQVLSKLKEKLLSQYISLK